MENIVKLGDQIKQAGLSRAAYYNRLGRGMSREEALATPKGRRASGPTMAEAMQRARSLGLMPGSRPPTQLVYSKLRSAGVPSMLAVMVGRQPLEFSLEQERHAAKMVEDPGATIRMVQSAPYIASLRALYANMGALTGEQVKAVLLNLVEKEPDERESAHQTDSPDQEHSPPSV